MKKQTLKPMTATYNTGNTITEISDYESPPDRPDPRWYGCNQKDIYQRNLEAWEAVMERYNANKAAYEKVLRTIPCSPECRGLWAAGQEVVEGKDYEVREVDWIPETEDEYKEAMYESRHELAGPVPKVLTAFPLPVKSEPKLEMKELPEPVGQFIINQQDVTPLMMPNGAYYHYVDVIKMLVRYKDYLPVNHNNTYP